MLECETARLSERIERLLDWGRMEAGRRTYDRQPQQIAALVAEAVQAFEAATVGRRRDVRVELQEGLPMVLADRGAMVDALVNLLSNAYKYTPGEREISIGTDADARAARLWVRDSGIGIAAKEQRRIFQKFYRVDERLSREVEGSGLGLAIVRHVVVGHGGRVEVESEPGRGSTFTIAFPRRQWAPAAVPVAQEVAR